MTKITLREVCRTLIDAKGEEWAESECAKISYKEFADQIMTSELLVDERAVRTKWRIAMNRGLFTRTGNPRVCIVNIPGIEATAGVRIPRPAHAHTRTHTHTHTNASPTAQEREHSRTREDEQADVTIGDPTVSYEEGSE